MDDKQYRRPSQGCPPRQEWPIIASIQVWARPGEDDPGLKVMRKCPHCGCVLEEIEREIA